MMKQEIRQNGKVVLWSDDENSIPVIFNNLCGINFWGEEYRTYIRYVAFEDMGFHPGEISYYRNGILYKTGKIPKL